MEGYERIVAVGGDGTVHEVINGLMALRPETRQSVRLGVVPAGSGNDFSRNLDIPRDARALAMLLASGEAVSADVGLVNGRFFANVAGVGFDAEVARFANRVPKVIPGTITYLVGVFAQLALFRNAGIRLWLDGKLLERRVLLVAIGNGARYAGGMHICPGARMDDGLFRVIVVRDLPKLEVLRVLPKVYPGTHVEHPAVEVYDAREVRIEGNRDLSIQADGEIVGTIPNTFQLVPRALRVIGLRSTGGRRETEGLQARGEPQPAPPEPLDARPPGERTADSA